MASPMSSTGQKIVHIAGWSSCGFYQRARTVLSSLSLLYPNRLRVVDHTFDDRPAYRQWLFEEELDEGFRAVVRRLDSRASKHTSSPFAWTASTADFSASNHHNPSDITSFVGGCDDTLDWCRAFCAPTSSGSNLKNVDEVSHDNDVDVSTNLRGSGSTYDYDLVVIGGGSGGLAASKEAASLGAKVAVLDFVRPSPQGTTWGLGGTCVNVGCIPKKLMHRAALLAESVTHDAPSYGLASNDDEIKTNGYDPSHQVKPVVSSSWPTLRTSVQNHVRGLNFKYRVDLRQNDVTYLNRRGVFKDAHTLRIFDKQGQENDPITARRFLVAVGGRPASLECPEGGGHLAIDSDDVFSYPRNPGKVLCVGASYISLECAGFLHGLGHDVTVAVRSQVLRGFDRECAERVKTYMEHTGVVFKSGVTISKLEEIGGEGDSDEKQIEATFSDGSKDIYNTVLAAVGRKADTAGLGLDQVGVKTNPSNGKIITKHEQTSCPNIYAVGDVMEGCPELTPVAIQAGIALSRRLFSCSKKPMDYVNVCTVVFTPLEYGCVGLSEEDAKAQYGEHGVEVYHKEFVPLEWALAPARGDHRAFCKVLVDNSVDKGKVLGIHYVGPEAGEVMQGFAVAMKTKGGLTFDVLVETVGIHPTSAEEITTLKVTKSSGKDATASGC